MILGAVGLVAALLLAGCSSSGQDDNGGSATEVSTVDPPSDPTGGERAAEAEALAAAIVEQSGEEVRALLVGVWDPTDGFSTSALGTADLESGEEAQVEEGFRIGSVTKTFIATVALQEVDEGSVDLGAAVCEYLPELRETTPDIGILTARRLLAMQTALPDFEPAVTGSAALDDSFTTTTWTSEELFEIPIASGEVTPVGQAPADYSNTNCTALGE